jgi:predicted MFS family arabinose efflux permease
VARLVTSERSPASPGAPPGLLVLLYLLAFVVMADARVISTVLSQIARDLDTTVAGVGVAMTAYLLAYGVFQLAWGPLADRVGPMRVIAAVAIAFAPALALTAFVPSLEALVGMRLLAGAVAAAFFPLALATVGYLIPYEDRHQAVAMLLGAVAAGQVMGATLGGLMAEVIDWRAMFVVDGALMALLVVPLWRMRFATRAPERPQGSPFAAHRKLLGSSRALVLYTAVLVEGALFFGGVAYLGSLLRERYGLSYYAIGLILALDGVAILVTSRLVGRASRRLGENGLILTGGLLMGGAFLFALAVSTWWAVLPAVVVLGIGFALCHSTFQIRATELAPAARGTAISLFAFSLFLGSGVGTAALGALIEIEGYDALLAVCGIGLAVLGLAAPRLTELRPAETRPSAPTPGTG